MTVPYLHATEFTTYTTGQPVAVLGNGHSLRQADIDRLINAGFFIIAINTSYQLCRKVDVLYAADYDWWRHHAKAHPHPHQFEDATLHYNSWRDVDCYRICASDFVRKHYDQKPWKDSKIIIARLINTGSGYTEGWGHLFGGGNSGVGGNSGYQALQISQQLNAPLTVMIGFDMNKYKGVANWHGAHLVADGEKRPTPSSNYDQWRRNFIIIKKESEKRKRRIINCTPNSSIDSFEKLTLEEVLNG